MQAAERVMETGGAIPGQSQDTGIRDMARRPLARTPKQEAKIRRQVKHGLTAGALPGGCGYVAKLTLAFRQSLEAAVLKAAGQIGVYEAALIQSACRWERHALLATRWLRLEADKMDRSERLAYSKAIADASTSRDRCLKELGLSAAARPDPWDILDGRQAAPSPPGSVSGHMDGRSRCRSIRGPS